MKTILVPTDFSENSKHAFHFAIHIAAAIGAKLVVYHVYHIRPGNPFMTLEMIKDLENYTYKESQRKLASFLAESLKASLDPKKDEVEIEQVIKLGFAIEEILEYTENRPFDLIVMGTKGANDLGDKLFGTNITTVINESHCPVMAIPHQVNFNGFRNLVIAIDLKTKAESLGIILDLATAFDSELNFLHVNCDNKTSYSERETHVGAINDQIHYTKSRYYELTSRSVEEGINQFVKAREADLLAMITHERTVFQKIFNPSLTQKIAHYTNLPLLAIPIDHKK